MNNPMPKDNEVDEKDMPEPLTYGMRRKGETAVIGLIPPKVHAIPPKVAEYLRDYEEVPLYSAATVAELRARADAAERRVVELKSRIQSALANVAVPKMSESRAEYFKAGARAAIAAVNDALTGADPT